MVRQKKLYAITKETFDFCDFRRLMQSVALHLYTKIEPIRLDYADCKVVTGKEFEKYEKIQDCNFLVFRKKSVSLVLRLYKTKKHYGEIIRVLPRGLEKVLRKYKQVLVLLYGDEPWLFYNKNGTKMKRNCFGKFLGRCFEHTFGRVVSAAMLRVIYCSTMFSSEEIIARKQAARNMCHGTTTQSKNYIKDLTYLL